MAKGSIRFDNEINVEVAVDPTQAAGSKLLSAVNLVDGQELGIGGGSELPEVTSADEGKVLAVNASGEWAAAQKIAYINRNESDVLDKTWSEINTLMRSDCLCIIKSVSDNYVYIGRIVSCNQSFLSVATYDDTYVADSADDYPILA